MGNDFILLLTGKPFAPYVQLYISEQITNLLRHQAKGKVQGGVKIMERLATCVRVYPQFGASISSLCGTHAFVDAPKSVPDYAASILAQPYPSTCGDLAHVTFAGWKD